MEKWDYKKTDKDLYLPKKTPAFLEVPEMTFIQAVGRGNPNVCQEYKDARKYCTGCLIP